MERILQGMRIIGRKIHLFCILIILALIFIGGSLFQPASNKNKEIQVYAQKNGINMSEYSENLIALYQKNADARKFVLEYPKKKNIGCKIDLTKYKNSKTVPLLMQWDQQWGYTEYAGDVMGLTGCGPTCLSMVTIFLTGDLSKNPKAIAEFATDHNYAISGTGTRWTLFSEGGKKLGLDVTELPLDKERIIENLKVGNPIICAMGPGNFTSSGHFIVLVDYVNGKIKVNDPNSYQNSEELWEYDKIAGQIKNLWVFR